MEAKALHEFKASTKEELSFAKGSIIKIIDKDTDPSWFKAEQDGREGFVPSNYIQLEEHSWYHGKVSRADAEKKLGVSNSRDGCFLFRDGESSPGGFSLSVKAGTGVQHFKILRDDAGKYFLWVVKFNSLNELISYHKTNTVSRSEEICLTVALPRGGALPAPAPAPLPAKKNVPAPSARTVTALFPFEPAEAGELRFKKGDVITVIDSSDNDWWKGSFKGETGMFPSTYVSK